MDIHLLKTQKTVCLSLYPSRFLLDISINLEINMQMDYTLKPLPPNIDRGLTIVNAEAGIMSIGGDYRFGSWSLTTVSAEAKAGASLDYIGFCADAALIRGEAGVRIKLPFTKKKLFLGAGADAISFGIRAYYDSERGRVEIWFI